MAEAPTDSEISSLRVKIWGARGSLPSPRNPESLANNFKEMLLEFVDRGYSTQRDVSAFLKELPIHRLGGYGGNTPCIEVTAPGRQLIIDGGSGIRQLGYELMAGPCGKGEGEVHILFTHFHWDHLLGLPFFAPIFIPGNRIHVYAVQPELPEIFQTLFKKPYFPVPLEKLGSKIEYHRLEPRKTVKFGDISVTPYALDHPDPCWGYRFERNGKVFSYCVDTECTRVTREQLGPDLPLYQGVDLMIFDAQYTLLETVEKVNWGHAAASLGLDIAMREGIKKVIFIHHDPASSDRKIFLAESQARQYYKSQLKVRSKSGKPGAAQDPQGSPDSPDSPESSGKTLHPVDWLFGYEGLVLDL